MLRIKEETLFIPGRRPLIHRRSISWSSLVKSYWGRPPTSLQQQQQQQQHHTPAHLYTDLCTCTQTCTPVHRPVHLYTCTQTCTPVHLYTDLYTDLYICDHFTQDGGWFQVWTASKRLNEISSLVFTHCAVTSSNIQWIRTCWIPPWGTEPT